MTRVALRRRTDLRIEPASAPNTEVIEYIIQSPQLRIAPTAPQGLHQAMIITDDPEGVRDAIFANLHRGVTLLEARGGFTGRPRPMLFVVVGAHEVGRLKLRVAEVDPEESFYGVEPRRTSLILRPALR